MNHEDMIKLVNNCTFKVWRNMRGNSPEIAEHISLEDLKAEANLAVVEAMEHWSKDSLVPQEFYLARSITNNLENYIRKEVTQRTGRVSGDFEESTETMASLDDTEKVRDIVRVLADDDKQLFFLIYAGYTEKEIEEALCLSTRDYRKIRSNLLTKVKECL